MLKAFTDLGSSADDDPPISFCVDKIFVLSGKDVTVVSFCCLVLEPTLDGLSSKPLLAFAIFLPATEDDTADFLGDVAFVKVDGEVVQLFTVSVVNGCKMCGDMFADFVTL